MIPTTFVNRPNSSRQSIPPLDAFKGTEQFQIIGIESYTRNQKLKDDSKSTSYPSCLAGLFEDNLYCWSTADTPQGSESENSTHTPSVPELPRVGKKYGGLFSYIRKFSSLEDGWNGDNSKTTSPEAIERAERLLIDILCKIADEYADKITHLGVCPTNAGGVQFELGNGIKDLDLEIEPHQNFIAAMKITRDRGELLTEEFNIESVRISALMEWLLVK